MGSGVSSTIPEKYSLLEQDQKAFYDEKFLELLKAGKSEDEAIAELAELNREPKREADPYRDLILDEVFITNDRKSTLLSS